MTSIQIAELDPDFGADGRADIRTPGNFYNELTAATTDASGQLLIYGGYARSGGNGTRKPGVARLLDNGEFDSLFGDMQDGLTLAPKDTTASMASSIARMADGALFITGPAQQSTPLLHYDKDGKHQNRWDLPSGSLSAAPRLLATANDKLLVATTEPGGGMLYRRHADGTADNSFGDNGQITFLAGNTFVAALHMVRSMSDSRFYLAGELGNDGFILRMNDNGEPDHSFAEGGVLRISMPGSHLSSCRKVIELQDGTLHALITSVASVSLVGLTQTGQINLTFNDGKPLGIPGDVGEDFAIQADGKILVAHRGQITGQQLTRFQPDGRLDKDFGDNGTHTFTSQDFSFLKSVTVQPDGKIVAAGTWGSITTVFRLMP